jgi:hypothetical protein
MLLLDTNTDVRIIRRGGVFVEVCLCPLWPKSHHAPDPTMPQFPSCSRSHHAPDPVMHQRPVPVPYPVPALAPEEYEIQSQLRLQIQTASFHSLRRHINFPRFRKVHFVQPQRANHRLVPLIFLPFLLVVRFFLPGNHQCQFTPRVPARRLSCVRIHLGAALVSLAFARLTSSGLSALVASTRIVPLSGCSNLPPL